MRNDKQWNVLAGAQIATGSGIAVFWLIFFTMGIPMQNPPACYLAFEHAFPLPDSALAISLVISAFDIQKGGHWGRKLSLCCAGGLLFLGLVDISFSLQNGVLSAPLPEVLVSGSISLWCIALGLWIIALQVGTNMPEQAPGD